jgi:predicted amidohydrolase YtcJ
VAAAARGRAGGEWIEGRGWDQHLWAKKEFPGHGLLDAAAPANPVVLRRIDGHALWANAAAMKLAGLTRATEDPAGGRIVRDAAGEPTGVFVDVAMDLIEAKIPAPDAATIRRRIVAAAAAATAAGLTGVQEMGLGNDVLGEYRRLAASGELPLRVYAMMSVETWAKELPKAEPDPDGAAMFVLRGIKVYADGALGSRGAALLEPYSDDPGNRGLTITDRKELERVASAALKSGWQVAVHAIGDRANREVLDAYAAAGVTPAARFRIEHAQVVAPEDFARFGKMGVIASMQPTHATSDMPWAEARLGPARARGAYAWRSMIVAGAHLAAGSDFPVEEVSPLLGLWAAVTRQDRDGQPAGGWHPDQKLTLDEAIHAYTVEPAYASFEEEHRGRIAPGYVADLTVYDRALSVETLHDVKVAKTIVGGRVVYDAAAASGR